MDDVTYSGNTGTVNFNSQSRLDGRRQRRQWQFLRLDIHQQYRQRFVRRLIARGASREQETQPEWNRPPGRTSPPLIWASPPMKNTPMTTRHVFVNPTADQGNPNEPQEDRIYRYFSRDGGFAPFAPAPAPPYIVINSGANATDPRPTFTEAGTGKLRYLIRDYAYTPFEFRTVQTTWGVTVDNHRSVVSDYRTNSVKIYDKTNGSLLGEIEVQHDHFWWLDILRADGHRRGLWFHQ